MILTLKIKLNNFLLLATFLLSLFLLFPVLAFAQNSLSLSVSPTLFEISANPTQNWSSHVRVINPNPYEITVFVNIVNFAPKGEAGLGRFIPVMDGETGGQTIAEWIEISSDPIVIPAEQTMEVPFSISVPEDAPPGGHFAAMLIGTKPPKGEDGVISVKTSQIVTTLMFMRVEGEVIESGIIRAFRTTDKVLEKPEVDFELRFENKGNVHLLPQGEIEILNMWGQVRGVIPVNRDTMFGNVLPDSIRKYNFTWTGEWSMADIGRYTAIATLGYGVDQKQFVHSETSFWVIPWKILTTVTLVVLSFILLIAWAIKVYIRKMLTMAGVDQSRVAPLQPTSNIVKTKRDTVIAPLEAGMLDLRGRMENTGTLRDRLVALFRFGKAYKTFFLVLLAVLIFVIFTILYIVSASVSERAYEVTISGLSEPVRITSEDVAYDELKESSLANTKIIIDETLPKLNIVNRSGVGGLAAKLSLVLEVQGYEVIETTTDFGAAEESTVIVYSPELAEQALVLSLLLEGALLSAYAGETLSEASMTIYVGKNLADTVQ